MKLGKEYTVYEAKQLNNNIRCIEIKEIGQTAGLERWLNNNIRCIEIPQHWQQLTSPQPLNNNIRCIEIRIRAQILRKHWS